MELSRLDYCQYLLVSQVNYTLTNFADHAEGLSHDAINRYLAGEKLSPRLVWEHVQQDIVHSESGYIVFDDTVADKNFSKEIEGVRRQYSGNVHGVVKGIGIGIVTSVYVNPELERWWVIDYRIFDPERDGKSKLAHVEEMLRGVSEEAALLYGVDGQLVCHKAPDADHRRDGQALLLPAEEKPPGG